jgi:hypothetical protein
MIAGMALRPAEWQRYKPVDGGRAVHLVAQMGMHGLRRVDVLDAPDAVTITLYEDVPPGTWVVHTMGLGAVLLVALPTPLEGRPVIDGASGLRRRDRIEPWLTTALPVPVGEDFSWEELTGRRSGDGR